MAEKEGLEELTKACEETVRVAEEHVYLWNEGHLKKSLWDGGLPLFHGWIAQDEPWNIYLLRKGEHFLFCGRNFCPSGSPGYIGRRAAEAMQSCHINANMLLEHFYSSLEKPLGEYLAKKKIKEIREKESKR